MSVSGDDRSRVPNVANRGRWRRVRRIAVVGAIVGLAGIQVLPYGRDHTNPPTTTRIAWDTTRTEELVRGACYDCHSHETRWPWYSHIAPMSWLIEKDVRDGRAELNFSLGETDEIEEATGLVRGGEMPPWFYRPLHAGARLSRGDQEELIRGLRATFGLRPESDGDPAELSGDD